MRLSCFIICHRTDLSTPVHFSSFWRVLLWEYLSICMHSKIFFGSYFLGQPLFCGVLGGGWQYHWGEFLAPTAPNPLIVWSTCAKTLCGLCNGPLMQIII